VSDQFRVSDHDPVVVGLTPTVPTQLAVTGTFYDADGKVPCQIDGGLKCFGHPIGASGLRMVYEMYLQLSGRAGERQRAAPVWGMTHNLGGFPSQNVSSVTIVGQYGA
jgi:acetyl-CoA C-acetyltransferase